jgi:hypothetical protein
LVKVCFIYGYDCYGHISDDHLEFISEFCDFHSSFEVNLECSLAYCLVEAFDFIVLEVVALA